ncbi:class I SAM-dependent methyltransferase [Candidatus Pelagibacter sp.]|nr:class I SAM-dependent methyltransferase [Candidatus Pelagibacter sp.]
MIKKFLDLGYQPLANKYLKAYKKLSIKKKELYRLTVGFDTKTKLVSLFNKIPDKIMFDSNYPYRSSMSKTMTASFKKLSVKIKKRFNPKLFLEIGSNDGALIKNFNKNQVICVEPCSNLAKITKRKGYFTYNNYWDLNLSNKIKSKFNTVDVIYSANTLTHINDLNQVFKSITNLLTQDGILIIEDPSFLECIKKLSYDQFYNEHIYIFSALSVKKLINEFDLELFDIEKLDTHGGSLRYYIKRINNNKIKIKDTVSKQISTELKFGLANFLTYKKFGISVKKSKNDLVKIFKRLKDKNKKIIGYGATAKACTVLNYCNIGNEIIDYFVDTTPDKSNRFMPGKNIKIKKYKKTLLNNVDYIYLGAWNFKNEIFKKERQFIKDNGRFITHVPKPKII